MISIDRPTLEVLSPGAGITVQDHGRPGWKRYGVPPGGAMDRHSLDLANRLAGNPPGTPGLECLRHGARIKLLRRARIAVAGGGCIADPIGAARSEMVDAGTIIELKHPTPSGIWTYLAIDGGVCEPQVFGSASAYPRGQIGRSFRSGDVVHSGDRRAAVTSGWKGAQIAHWDDSRNFLTIPPIRIWPGPQRETFDSNAWSQWLGTAWTVSPNSDRTGYRLDGSSIVSSQESMRSEPVVIGSIQIPPNGQPIVTMRDGPTVGGYPKIAIVDDRDLDWLAQAAPGVRFHFVEV